MDEVGIVKNSSPKWKRPDEVMKYYRLKQKKRALSSRMNGNDNVASMFSHNSNSEDSFEYPSAKRRNPFASRFDNKSSGKPEVTTDESGIETDVSNDSTFFLLLNNSEKKAPASVPYSFSNILKHLNAPQPVKEVEEPVKRTQRDGLTIPIDWSLKSKLRIMSPESFTWSATLKTCEEACSITGFVRCLDACDNKKKLGSNTQIDVTANAKFHQSCLYWQHPNISWLPMFPRSTNVKVKFPNEILQVLYFQEALKNAPHPSLCDSLYFFACEVRISQILTAQLQMSQSLATEWTGAFKSLYQLVRVNQCPYFYVIANHFYCLFRAAGMAGIQEIHAIITPTSKGFRQMLEDEGIAYTMPLKKKRSSNEFSDSSENPQAPDGEELSCDEAEDWLESLAVDAQEIKRYTTSQKSIDHGRERKIDGSDESLVVVRGMEIQSFFNVLVNCKSCISSTGPYAGIPPTLISPNAFLHGTLKSCRIRDSIVQVDGSVFHSIQVEGPVLPHGLRQMCSLLNKEGIQYSISLSTVKQTLGFTYTSKQSQVADEKKKISSVFLKENLAECGLSESLLNVFCDPDPEMYDNIDSIKPNSVDV